VAQSRSYFEKVRAALGDLPPEAQAELLADIDEQVALDYGSAELYAAALRAAAGYPPRPRHMSLEARRRRSRVVKLLRAISGR
jgi:hypothetical protein